MRYGKQLLVWIGIVAGILALYYGMESQSTQSRSGHSKLSFSEFLADVEAGSIETADIRGPHITGLYEDGRAYGTYAPEYPSLVDKLNDAGVRIDAEPQESAGGAVLGILISWFPIFLLIGVWIFLAKQMQGGKGGGAMGFGRSRARMQAPGTHSVMFADVAGIEEAKEELTELVDYLKHPNKFQALGGKIPKGCLLVGSPGTGKTLLAKAIAGEAGVPFFSISGSDFVEMFVGVGASRVRDLFEQGKKNAPCLIFIDEIDAVGRHRGAGIGGGNDEREQTLNQMLVEMDGFETNSGVIIIAATNRPDVLDPALLRPGRFDRQIVVSPPDVAGREKILRVHTKNVPLSPDVNLHVIARGTPGFTGADLANLVNESALLAARKNRRIVTMEEMEQAKDKVLMGVERKSMILDKEERELTAYHEAGHAIVGLHCPESDPIHKATIIPRGRALGLVMRLPEKDRVSYTRGRAKADIAVAMGGRVAEEMIFGYEKVTSGASSDINMATSLARSMVTEWGMSDAVGPLRHAGSESGGYLGGQSGGGGNVVSEETAKLIDSETKHLVEEGHERARDILKKHEKELHKLAEGLLEYETLTGAEIRDLLDGKQIHRPDDDTDNRSFGAGGSVPSFGDKNDASKPEGAAPAGS